jgi:PAS domain S-box-containing protein
MLISSNHLPINSSPKLDVNHHLLTIQTAIINQLAQVIRGKLVINDVLPSLCHQLSETLHMSGCLIFRADQLPPLAASTERQVEVVGRVCQDFFKYYRSWLAQGKLVLLPVSGRQIPTSLQDSAKKGDLSSLLIVPFLHRQSYIGAMALYLCEQEREWVPQEISFVQAIADQCATVLAFTLLEERCQLEAGRRQTSETRLKALCNQTCQLMGLLTPEGIVVEANHTALAFVGLRKQDILGQPFWQMQWWDYASESDQQIQEVFSQRLFRGIAAAGKGQFVRYEAELVGRGGNIVTLDIALTPHQDETEQVVLLVFEAREITALKRAQSELQESVARNKALLAVIPDLILRLTRSGIYVDCKTARADFLAIPVQDCIGKHLHQVLPRQVAGLIWHHVELAILNDQIQVIEYQLWLNGKSHDFEARIVKSGDDEVVAVVQDVTERVQARVALEQTNQALEVRVEERTAALRESNHILRAEIVDRKKAEVRRRESEERFRQAVVNAPFPIMIHASDGEIVQINQVWTELTGFTHDQIPTIAVWTQKACGEGQKFQRSELRLRHSDSPEIEPTTLLLQNKASAAIRCCDLNEQVDEGEFPLITKDGDHRIWYFRSAPSGCLIDGRSLTISMAVDVTERKQAERSQRFLHSVTQAIFESVDFHSALKVALKEVCAATGWDLGEAWVPSTDGSVLECSPAWYGKESLEAFHCASIALTFAPGVGLPGRVWQSKQAQWRRDIASESDENFFRLQLAKQAGLQSGLGIPLFTTTGVLAVLVFYMFESQDEDERLTELISASTELGVMIQRKQAEGEVLNAFTKEKELTELKSRFIAMASHEFRTPLTTIQSSSELLEYYSQKWVHEKKLTHFHRIQTSVKHMTKLLNDVLIIGRAEAGKLTFNPASLDLEGFCHNLVEELQLNDTHQHTISFACVRKLEKSVSIDSSLSSLVQTKLLCMDETLLRQILENLLSNAIKYSPKGSIIEFTLQYSSTQAVFQIRDQGIGIPLQDQPLLFESFHRATNVGTIAGTGLGLAIVKKCVDIHQGQVAVESEIGVGTTFTVTLPT